MAIKKVRMKPPGYTDIVHPETSADVVIEDSSHRFVTDSEKGIWNAKQASITGGATTITSSNLTASRALVSDASGKVAVSSATSKELEYLSGVTSSVQTQLNGKSATSHNHTLDGLSNTTITSNTNGEILRWNGTAWVNNTLAEAGIHKAVTGLTPHMILYSGTDGYGATNVHYFTLENFFTDTPQQASAKEIYDKLGLGGIVESGSNANGRYVKFGDGTMLAWHALELKNSVYLVYEGDGVAEYWYFPAGFSEVPIFGGMINDVSSPPLFKLSLIGVPIDLVGVEVIGTNTSYTFTDDSIVFTKVMAIGRWK